MNLRRIVLTVAAALAASAAAAPALADETKRPHNQSCTTGGRGRHPRRHNPARLRSVMIREDAALTEFVATRSAALFRTAYLLTGDRHLAEGLLQTALAKAYPLWVGIRDPQAAESAVQTAMVKALIGRRRPAWTRVAATPPGLQAGPSDRVETQTRLWPILGTLPPRQRAVIVLLHHENLTEPQSAAILGCSTAAVKSHHARALHTLLAHLAELEDARGYRDGAA